MSDFERRVLDAIAAQKLAPKSAYLFLAKRSVFWGLAAVSIFFGALSFAILLFIVTDFFTTGWRTLDNIHFNEALASIPALWLLLLGLFTASATYGLSHTRRGYRLKPSHIAGISLAAGLGLGGLLHAADAGRSLHEFLAARFPAYHAFTYVPFVEWSRPDEGYLGGTVLGKDENGIIHLLDFQDKTWLVDISSAAVSLDSHIADEGDVAIEGERTGANTFRARTISEFD